jgi:hypothetical protein
VPSRLILVHELSERFSLQPSGQGMSLNGRMASVPLMSASPPDFLVLL